MVNFPTCGSLRERKYLRAEKIKDEKIDIGYFKAIDRGEYSVRSFLIDRCVFSDEKVGVFFDALRKRDLNPESYISGWKIFVEKSKITAWKNRKQLYK